MPHNRIVETLETVHYLAMSSIDKGVLNHLKLEYNIKLIKLNNTIITFHICILKLRVAGFCFDVFGKYLRS